MESSPEQVEVAATLPAALPSVDAFSWWTRGAELVFAAQVPIKSDGTFELGSTGDQMTVLLQNLDVTLAEAGLGRNDVLQVILFVTRMSDLDEVNRAWTAFFAAPRPSRAVIGASALAIDGMTVEALVYASRQRSEGAA